MAKLQNLFLLPLIVFSSCSLVEKIALKEAKTLFDSLDEQRADAQGDAELKKKIKELDEKIHALDVAKEIAESSSVNSSGVPHQPIVEHLNKLKTVEHHKSHIHIHQYYIHKNHLSDEKRARIEMEIKYHQDQLKKLNQS